jgi:hypothetical protein
MSKTTPTQQLPPRSDIDLPKGWSQASVLDLTDLIRGVSYSKGEATDPPPDDSALARGLSLSTHITPPHTGGCAGQAPVKALCPTSADGLQPPELLLCCSAKNEATARVRRASQRCGGWPLVALTREEPSCRSL